MDLENVYVVDIEADGLLDTVTKIHIMSVGFRDENGKWEVSSTTDYEDMKKVVCYPDNIIVGHNFILYDAPALEKVLGVKVEAKLICTLGLSWALYPWKNVHGLEHYGEMFGVPKVEVDSSTWSGLREEELNIIKEKGDKTPLSRALSNMKTEFDDLMKERCEEDVKINVNAWITMTEKIGSLYKGDEHVIPRYIKYINFKMQLLREQEKNRVKIDVPTLEKNISYFEELERERIEAIKPNMPKIPHKVTRKRPKNLYKKDMSLSKAGERWFDMLKQMDLPEDYDGEVEVITKYKEPNPKSHSQVKDWLFSLGWEPKEFKESTSTDPSKEGDMIPQVRVNGHLCESVLELKDECEGIEDLEGLSVIVHRLGCLRSIKKNLRDGEYIVARASGLTNTLRYKHSAPVVNLKSVSSENGVPLEDRDIRDGRTVREVFMANEECVFVGSDLKSLEDRFKQHQIRDLDPEFVESMLVDGFDPHLDLAVFAGAITQEQADQHKKGEKDFKEIRSTYKSANYACQYGVGAKTLAKTTGKTEQEAASIIESYWERNWAIRAYAEAQKVVSFGKEDWIINPINGFRYSLRSEKDRFSTLTQGGSTYVFDMWIKLLMDEGVKIGLNVHDEWASGCIDKGDEEFVVKMCKEKIGQVNDILSLKREMDCDTQVSDNYANVH